MKRTRDDRPCGTRTTAFGSDDRFARTMNDKREEERHEGTNAFGWDDRFARTMDETAKQIQTPLKTRGKMKRTRDDRPCGTGTTALPRSDDRFARTMDETAKQIQTPLKTRGKNKDTKERPRFRAAEIAFGSNGGQAPAGSAYGPIGSFRFQDADSPFLCHLWIYVSPNPLKRPEKEMQWRHAFGFFLHAIFLKIPYFFRTCKLFIRSVKDYESLIERGEKSL